MRLLREICEVDSVEGTDSEELLLQLAEGFLRAGGSITLDDWATLEDSERYALMYNGDKIRAEQAVITAGSLDPEYAARIAEPYDDGQAVCDLAVRRAVETELLRGKEQGVYA